MVRAVLARTPFVITFYDAPPQAGGLGATIAELIISDSQPQERR
jgi:dsDNA-specific endonuclease/ATPase MutS2